MKPIDLARLFVRSINKGDVERIAALMDEEHVFVDSAGRSFSGRETMRQGWAEYLAIVPDYRIEVDEAFSAGPVVVLLGTARGTYSPDGELRPENEWSTPAAWRLEARGDQVAEWRVFADNEPIRHLSADS